METWLSLSIGTAGKSIDPPDPLELDDTTNNLVSSFRNTDLHFQLQQHKIDHLVVAGLVANTCLESTARDAYEQ